MSTPLSIRRAFTMAVLAAAIVPAAIRARRLAQAQSGAVAPRPQPAAQAPPPRAASHMRRLPEKSPMKNTRPSRRRIGTTRRRATSWSDWRCPVAASAAPPSAWGSSRRSRRRPAEADPLPVHGIGRRLHRRLVQRQLQARGSASDAGDRRDAPTQAGAALVGTARRLGPLDRPPAPLFELPLARGRLLQRRHLVDVHRLAAQRAAGAVDGGDGGRLHPAGAALCCPSRSSDGTAITTGAGSACSRSCWPWSGSRATSNG